MPGRRQPLTLVDVAQAHAKLAEAYRRAGVELGVLARNPALEADASVRHQVAAESLLQEAERELARAKVLLGSDETAPEAVAS